MRYLDRKNNRLVYIEHSATPAYWDQQWEDDRLKKSILAGVNDRFVFPATRKYLAPGSKILEGGCGKGQFVYSLHKRGYKVIGVDFAQETVTKVSELFPELTIKLGDVRKLDFAENSFDGYWSLGVIEHFYGGYDAIAKEMYRVLRPGGYLFLTFPYMSPLRRLKARLNTYSDFSPDTNMDNFYQFALDARSVIKHFTQLGFRLIEERPYEGFKGLKDESGPCQPILQTVYNNKSFFGQIVAYIISTIFAPISGHTILLVLRKNI